METTEPIFVIGSGRSGTAAFYKMLAGNEYVEIHHEFLCTHVQPLGVLYYMGIKDKRYIVEELRKIYGSAIKYSNKKLFIDCSNKLTWLIEPLVELFPNCKFVAITRDGRRVVTSYYYKLRCEMYDDESTRIMLDWYLNGCKDIPPPPEKKYWWNIPPSGHESHEKFKSFTRFERICYHWNEAYTTILNWVPKLGENKIALFKLEEIVRSEAELRKVFNFMGIPYKHVYSEILRRPRNVSFPLSFSMTEEQEEIFWKMCGRIMDNLGYKRENIYEFKY